MERLKTDVQERILMVQVRDDRGHEEEEEGKGQEIFGNQNPQDVVS